MKRRRGNVGSTLRSLVVNLVILNDEFDCGERKISGRESFCQSAAYVILGSFHVSKTWAQQVLSLAAVFCEGVSAECFRRWLFLWNLAVNENFDGHGCGRFGQLVKCSRALVAVIIKPHFHPQGIFTPGGLPRLFSLVVRFAGAVGLRLGVFFRLGVALVSPMKGILSGFEFPVNKWNGHRFGRRGQLEGSSPGLCRLPAASLRPASGSAIAEWGEGGRAGRFLISFSATLIPQVFKAF